MKTITIDKIDYQIYPKENGNLILKPIQIINNLDSLNEINFCSSQILSCKINNESYENNKYKSILNKIYELIGDGTKIIKNSCLNIKTILKKSSGCSRF